MTAGHPASPMNAGRQSGKDKAPTKENENPCTTAPSPPDGLPHPSLRNRFPTGANSREAIRSKSGARGGPSHQDASTCSPWTAASSGFSRTREEAAHCSCTVTDCVFTAGPQPGTRRADH